MSTKPQITRASILVLSVHPCNYCVVVTTITFIHLCIPPPSPALIRSLFMYPHTYPCFIVFKSSSFQSANTHVNCQNCPTKTRKRKNPKSLGNMYRLESLPFHAGVVRYQALSGRYPRIPPVPVCELWQPCNLPSVYTRAEGRQWDKGT